MCAPVAGSILIEQSLGSHNFLFTSFLLELSSLLLLLQVNPIFGPPLDTLRLACSPHRAQEISLQFPSDLVQGGKLSFQ